MKKIKVSFTSLVLLGLFLGIFTGLFFGEHCQKIQVIGDIFIRLLQMTVLPYIMLALIVGIGSLDPTQGRTLVSRAGLLLLFFWSLAIAVVLVMPLAFPEWKEGSFYSPALIPHKEASLLDIYFSSNIFASMVNNAIPAVVLFSILLGVALMGLKNKETLIENLSILSDAIMKVVLIIMKLAPIGIFALVANLAGNMTLEELSKVQVFVWTFILMTLLLGLVILPFLVKTFTSISFKECLGQILSPLITAFAAGSTLIVLPQIIENLKQLLKEKNLSREETNFYAGIIVPVALTFPALDKLCYLLFILFSAWLSGSPIEAANYPRFLLLGVVSFFGSLEVAIPFMLDMMKIPADYFQLFIVINLITGRFGTLLSVMNLFVFSLLATCLMTGVFSFSFRKFGRAFCITIGSALVLALAIKFAFAVFVHLDYKKYEAFAGMKSLISDSPIKTYREADVSSKGVYGGPILSRVKNTGILRVGFISGNIPFVFFNKKKELVGFDVDMARTLAGELGCELEFVQVSRDTLAQSINDGKIDLVMTGLVKSTDRLREMHFSNPPINVSAALIVKDHRRAEFTSIENIRSIKKLRVGTLVDKYFAPAIKSTFPNAEVVKLSTLREFFEDDSLDIDVMLVTAESGSAWTIWFPEYQVVVPKPKLSVLPLGYAFKKGDDEFLHFINNWLDLKKKSPIIDRLYEHWILGKAAKSKTKRWSIAKDVLGVID